ncbi:AAA family ATPase [Alloalcanivorax marinus]|uniref:AAA family ATPase n=1 Tax=Alloalcanivorax marinus TaxID=1177169 RepID=UPI0019323213|nr:AAA family ATPase [Alloalcanivorax marinus]MBL7251235.1 AAA family ATPase [Alloalcanivorax marinus]
MKRLKSINLKNFKSILSQKIEFGEFNVLVGANGSGKSNLVKAIEMIADIKNYGATAAVANQGWGGSIVPRRYAEDEIKDQNVTIEYEIDLGSPWPNNDKTKNLKNPTVFHSIELNFPKPDEVVVNKEKIRLDSLEVLGAFFYGAGKENNNVSKEVFSAGSFKLVFEKTKTGKVRYRKLGELTEDNRGKIFKGLGIDFLVDADDWQDKFDEMMKRSFGDQGKISKSERIRKYCSRSFFELGGTSFLFPSYGRFLDVVSKISRFDILLSNIRLEQKAQFSSGLYGDGSNLPSVIKALKDETDDAVWGEIFETISEIAPHIVDLETSTLATGKQYIEFEEKNSERRVESWDTSDGTLRAVSILAAVEGAPEGAILIIEEPEQNLHPWAVSSLISHIRRAIKRKGLQVFVTTHSQQVLESVDPGEVLVASRCFDQGTQIFRLDQLVSNMEFIDMGDVGRLWVKGLLKGVPGDGF